MSPRRLLLACAMAAVLALAAAPAHAAQVVSGTVTPSALKGKPTIVMFLHPF